VPGVSKRHAWYSSDDGTGHIESAKLAWIELRGPTDCSIFSQAKWALLEKRLGPDPLNGDGPEKAIERIRKSKKSIGELLMDQKVIAGMGNIYRAELLYRARLSPFTAGKDVPEATLRAIWRDAVPLMKAGMVDRRIVTTKVEDRPSGDTIAPKEETHYVYRRNGRECFVCGTTIEKKEMAGRNLFWCPVCQAA
jgi:endonuclease-8